MKIVLLETSGVGGEVALADETGLLAHEKLDGSRRHARDLAPALDRLLRELGWEPRTVELVAVDIGPGSYTGLRVGIMTAKAFAFATGSALLGVAALPILAAAVPPEWLRAEGIVDAQQGMIYRGAFERGEPGGALQSVAEIDVIEAKSWADALSPETYVTGPALERFEGLLRPGQPAAVGEMRKPRIEDLWKLALRDFQAGCRDDPFRLAPLYLRASSAQRKWDVRHGPEGARANAES